MNTEEKEQIRLKKNEKNRKYRLENKEKIQEYKKSYYENNKDKYLIYNRREARKAYMKDYTEKNFLHLKELRNIHYKRNKDKIKKQCADYYKNHREKLKEIHKQYFKNRIKTDPIFKMVCSLRCRLYKALKVQGATKDMASKELFGADQEFVWKHLESQFKVGMTRKNHSLKGWHIDHIKPMASFNLNDPEEQKKCCHYSNLQPLWWWENLEKSDKIVA